MLWFGRQPASSASDDAPSEDAAGEMEVASTGRRGWVSPEDGSGGMPGARELDEALAGFDSLREPTAPTAAEPRRPSDRCGAGSGASRRVRRLPPQTPHRSCPRSSAARHLARTAAFGGSSRPDRAATA